MTSLAHDMKTFAEWLKGQAANEDDDDTKRKLLNAADKLEQEAFHIAQVVIGMEDNVAKHRARISAAQKSCMEMISLITANLPISAALQNQGLHLNGKLSDITDKDIETTAQYCARASQIAFMASSVSLLSSMKSLAETNEGENEFQSAIQKMRRDLNAPNGTFLVNDNMPPEVIEIKGAFDEIILFITSVHSTVSVSSSTMVSFIQLTKQVESVTNRIVNVGIKYRTLLLSDVQTRLKDIANELEDDIEDLEEFIKNLTLAATIISVITRIVSLGM